MRNRNGFASTFILFGILSLFLIVMSILLFTMNNSSVLNSGIKNKLTNEYEQNEDKYVSKEYLVTADLNGGDGWLSSSGWATSTTNPNSLEKSMKKGDKYQNLPIPKRNGFEFREWVSESGVSIIEGQTDVPAISHTIYASWNYKAKPEITGIVAEGRSFSFKAQGASGFFVSKTQTTKPDKNASGWSRVDLVNGYGYGASKNLTDLGDKGTYYVWAKDSSGSVSDYYATVDVYKIVYYANEGTIIYGRNNEPSSFWVDPRIFIPGQTYYHENLGYPIPLIYGAGDDRNPDPFTLERGNWKFKGNWILNRTSSYQDYLSIPAGDNTDDFKFPVRLSNGNNHITDYRLNLYAQWSKW